jgi:uncharacterized SAM-binding protein YcdF (DUF218 family)
LALRKRLVLCLAALAVAVLLLWLTAPVWLRGIGKALIVDSPPRQADAALVLAGDHRGHRILKACELLQAGRVPFVLVSGPTTWYGINEADLAIRFADARGCQSSRLEPVYLEALSTKDEARAFRSLLERRGVRNLLLVTSNYHTARALRTFRREIPSIDLIPVAASDGYFSAESWWHTREGQKTVFFEVSKTIADWVGL